MKDPHAVIMFEPRRSGEPELSPTEQVNEVFVFDTEEGADAFVAAGLEKYGDERTWLVMPVGDPSSLMARLN